MNIHLIKLDIRRAIVDRFISLRLARPGLGGGSKESLSSGLEKVCIPCKVSKFFTLVCMDSTTRSYRKYRKGLMIYLIRCSSGLIKSLRQAPKTMCYKVYDIGGNFNHSKDHSSPSNTRQQANSPGRPTRATKRPRSVNQIMEIN